MAKTREEHIEELIKEEDERRKKEGIDKASKPPKK